MNKFSGIALCVLMFCAAGFRAVAASTVVPDGTWLQKVPAKDRARRNPLEDRVDAAEAGQALFARSCASCHGEDAEGLNGHPNLHSDRVHLATDGELYWLLTNGSLRRGMPSWSRLPEAQRWQLVRYLHTLPVLSQGEPGR